MENIEINRKKKWYRLWEIFPGLLTWGAFILPVILSIYYPVFIASLILVYAIYWLAKSFRMSYHLIVGYQWYRQDIKKDWLALCEERFSQKDRSWKEIYHLIILATYKEDIEILKSSLRAIANSQYPMKKVFFVLATEERDKTRVLKFAKILKKEFGNDFYHFLVTNHPQDIVGEVKGKGSNITYAGKESLKIINQEKIAYENVIVTTLDADNRLHPKYLANLTYKYLETNKPIQKSFQPLAMFFNNIWNVPLVIRSISVGSSFWQMIESTRPYRLRNFSAHAQSLAALVKTNFWSTKTIVEDGHQYWRSYLAFEGNYSVVPLYVPVYQDAVLSPNGYLATFVEQYLQKRRWAWGCSDIPYVMTKIFPNPNIPFWNKSLQTLRLIEGHFSWATTSVILALIGWLPRFLNADFRSTVLAYNFPIFYSRILTTALIGLVITLIISMLLLPARRKSALTWSIILEWVLSPIMLPFSNVIFSSLPAIESQTRLLLGQSLEYRVTRKAVVK